MPSYGVKFVPFNEIPKGAEIIENEERVKFWREFFESCLADARRERSTLKNTFGQRALEVAAWLSELEAECWTPQRTVLVKFPL